MDHNKLLRTIDWSGHTSTYMALLAVAELHKEQEVTLPDGEWGIICEHCSEYGVYVLYPCPTIETIEKELENV